MYFHERCRSAPIYEYDTYKASSHLTTSSHDKERRTTTTRLTWTRRQSRALLCPALPCPAPPCPLPAFRQQYTRVPTFISLEIQPQHERGGVKLWNKKVKGGGCKKRPRSWIFHGTRMRVLSLPTNMPRHLTPRPLLPLLGYPFPVKRLNVLPSSFLRLRTGLEVPHVVQPTPNLRVVFMWFGTAI